MSHAQIMQATSNLHHSVIKTSEVVAKDIFENATSFNTTDNIFNDNPYAGNDGIDEAVFDCQRCATWLLFGLVDDDIFGPKALETSVL